jgi:hypothetical protein
LHLSLLQLTFILQVGDVEPDRKNWGRGVVLQDSIALVSLVGLKFLSWRFSNFVKVSDLSLRSGGVIGEANVEEARVFLGNKLVHVAYTWSHQQNLILGDRFRRRLSCNNLLFGLEEFVVFIVGKLIVLELLVDLVVLGVLELAKKQLEVDTHIGMVVQGHDSTFLDEEKNKSVVFVSLDGDTVQLLLEMVLVGGSIGASDS